MEHEIRSAAPADLDAVRAIVRAAYQPYVARIGREPGPMLDDYRALIAGGRVTVIERDGAVRGVLVLVPEADALLLDNVAVDPSVRGMGFGRALIRHAERVARDANRGAIRLYTNEAMAENIALYARLGYRETHRAEDEGFRRVYMVKALR